jgi:hypothetical protein
MPSRSRQADACIAGLELSLTDLRAHFEAQLRTVTRAEQCLLRCRGAQNAVAFKAAADTFRDQLSVIAENRKRIATLVNGIVDDGRELDFAGRAPEM